MKTETPFSDVKDLKVDSLYYAFDNPAMKVGLESMKPTVVFSEGQLDYNASTLYVHHVDENGDKQILKFQQKIIQMKVWEYLGEEPAEKEIRL